MKIGFSKTFGGVLLVLGGVGLLLALVLFLESDSTNLGSIISGVVGVIAGGSMLTSTYFEIGGGVLTVRAMIGPASKRYTYESIRDVRVDGSKVYVGNKKVGVARSQADKRDWQAFVDYLAREQAAA